VRVHTGLGCVILETPHRGGRLKHRIWLVGSVALITAARLAPAATRSYNPCQPEWLSPSEVSASRGDGFTTLFFRIALNTGLVASPAQSSQDRKDCSRALLIRLGTGNQSRSPAVLGEAAEAALDGGQVKPKMTFTWVQIARPQTVSILYQ
jgi:hypothetical protein